MARAMMNLLVGLFLVLATVNAVPLHFPGGNEGKTVIYKYHADVKAGAFEPAPYASHFVLEGHLHVKHDTTDPTLKNAYYIALADLQYGLHNGQLMYHQNVETTHPIVEEASAIYKPFMVVYDENGKFQGMKLIHDEAGWSKNIKQGIASMLQLDLSVMHLESPMKHHSFMTTENTIHGDCMVSYNVHPKDYTHDEENNVFVVTKHYEPKSCSHFIQTVFSHTEHEKCPIGYEDTMVTSSRRHYEIEHLGNEVLIKKMVGHGTINYYPLHAKSEAHYLMTNTTLVFEKIEPVVHASLPAVTFKTVPMIRDITYVKPEEHFAHKAARDLTYGRHIVKQDVLVSKVMTMLEEATDYLEENHIDLEKPDWKHGQTINRITHTLSLMDVNLLEQLFEKVNVHNSPRDVTLRHIFFGILPHVGTHAVCHFVRNIVVQKKVSDVTAVLMLSKLSLFVKNPTEQLLVEMEDLVKLGPDVSVEVKKTSILCFATMVHKVFKHEHNETVNPLLTRYLQHFFEHVKNEPKYEMRMVYLMAIKNVEVGNIHKILAPIISGKLVIPDKPFHIRVQAIWAIKRAVANDYQFAHDLLWPVLSDPTLPTSVRVAAYDVIVDHLHEMGHTMELYWLMVYEKNENLYNYHLTTMRSIADSVSPCLLHVREVARKILRFSRVRNVNVHTFHRISEYHDPKYGHGELIKTCVVTHEDTGLPYTGYVEHINSMGRKSTHELGIHWNIEGMGKATNILFHHTPLDIVKQENVKNLLLKAANDMPHEKPIHIDLVITLNNRVVMIGHFDESNLTKLIDTVKQWKNVMTNGNFNMQHVTYDNMFEMTVPTDMGLTAAMYTKIPRVMSFKANITPVESKLPLNFKFEVDTRIWKHGEYVMSIYNPIVDVWHSVHRVMTEDIVLPIDVHVGYNPQTKIFKMTLPRLPKTHLSVAGIKHHAKNIVTITHDETDALKKSCSTCHHHEEITMGAVHKKEFHHNVDSKDTGLLYGHSIFDCESHVTPVTQTIEWFRVLSPEFKNTVSGYMQWIVGMHQMATNDFLSPEIGTCGKIYRIEPSVVHPTSHIDMTVRVSVEDLDHTHEKMHALHNQKYNIRGTMDVKAAATDVSVRSWDVNVNVDLSQGHFTNSIKMLVTRITPGEKNLKICIDGQKNYPVFNEDPLKLFTTVEETYTKVIVMAGFTDEDKCVRDDAMIMMSIKGEMSGEQKEHTKHDKVHGQCSKDIKNPQFQTVQSHIPKTWSCIQEAVLHSTLRKYTTTITHKKLPEFMVTKIMEIEDYFRTMWLPYMKYVTSQAEPGTIKMVVEYPVGSHNADVSVSGLHGQSYEMHELPIGDPVWDMTMDNTHFSTMFLQKYKHEMLKFCTVYPHVIITADNGTIPYLVPDKWTLLTGDHQHQSFAVFVKSMENNKLAMKMFVGQHELDIVHTDNSEVVTIDGDIVEHHEKGFVVPKDNHLYTFRGVKIYQHMVVQMHHLPIMIMSTPSSVTVIFDTTLRGRVTGMCGHLDNKHKEKLPKIYNIAHF